VGEPCRACTTSGFPTPITVRPQSPAPTADEWYKMTTQNEAKVASHSASPSGSTECAELKEFCGLPGVTFTPPPCLAKLPIVIPTGHEKPSGQVFNLRIAKAQVRRVGMVGRRTKCENTTSSPPIQSRIPLLTGLQAIVQVFDDYGLVVPTPAQQAHVLNHWTALSSLCGWMKFLKYKLAAWRAWALSVASGETQEKVPTPPGCEHDRPEYLIGRTSRQSVLKMQKWVERAQSSISDHTLLYSFIESVNAVKGALELPSRADLDKAEDTTYESLTTPRAPAAPVQIVTENCVCVSELSSVGNGISPRTQTVTDVCPTTIEAQIARTVHELFRGCEKFSHCSDLNQYRMPSKKATYVTSCAENGTLGDMDLRGFFIEANRGLGTGVLPSPDVLLRPSIALSDDFVLDEAGLAKSWNRFVTLACIEAQEESTDTVTLMALAEALKCRVISKGPGMKYFALKPVQKFVHNVLRAHPVFQLIGRSCDSYVLDQQLLSKRFPTDNMFLSGDYAEATNRIRSRYSRYCGELVLEAIGITTNSFLHSMFLDCLCGAQIKTKRAPAKPQVEGQLMGSIVSFPILCLINAAVCRWSMELSSGLTYTLASVPLLINGDDCVFPGNQKLFRVWEVVANQVGLEKSVGKTYFSSSFCSINSRTYVLPGGNFARGFLPVQYVNYRLLAGNARSNGASGFSKTDLVDSVDPALSFGARQTSLLDEAPLFLHERLTLRFLTKFAKQLEGGAERIPKYLPRSEGGLGLTRPCNLTEIRLSDTTTGLSVQASSDFRDPNWVELAVAQAGRLPPCVSPPGTYGDIHKKALKLVNFSPKWIWNDRPCEDNNRYLPLYLYSMLWTENRISSVDDTHRKNLVNLNKLDCYWRKSEESLRVRLEQSVESGLGRLPARMQADGRYRHFRQFARETLVRELVRKELANTASVPHRLGGWMLDKTFSLSSDLPTPQELGELELPLTDLEKLAPLLRTQYSDLHVRLSDLVDRFGYLHIPRLSEL
jgi:hypothetical protein